MRLLSLIERTAIGCVCLCLSYKVLADSAAAWKAYQEGRNPYLELGLIILGAVVFFVALGLLHKLLERRKKRTGRHRISGKQK